MEKILLSFDEKSFQRADKAHKAYKEAVKQLIQAADKLGVKTTEKKALASKSIYVDIASEVFNNASAGATLPEGINKMKFLELMDIDLSDLSKASNAFNSHLQFKDKPTEESFKRYATGEEQLATYYTFKDLVNQLNELDAKGLVSNKIGVVSAFAHKVILDYASGKFKVNL
jgi:hypothetical protein